MSLIFGFPQVPPFWIWPPLRAGWISTFTHKPAAATFPGSQQYPKLPFTVWDSWKSSSVFWSQKNTKQIGGKVQPFHVSEKTEVPKVQST